MSAALLLILAIIGFVILGAWGVKFPRTKKDWHKDRHETFSLLVSLTIFLLMFLLLWYVVSVADYPPAMDMILWGTIITFAVISIASVFLPRGVMVKFEKKKKKNIIDDE